MDTKTCSFCKRELPFDQYGKNPKGKFGLRSQCKKCTNWKVRYKHKTQHTWNNSHNPGMLIDVAAVHKQSKWRGMRYAPKTGMLYSIHGPILALTCGYRVFGLDGRTTRVHRFVAERLLEGFTEDSVIDHINRKPLDNRINNLRIADRTLNSVNSGMRKDNTSGYKGVCYHKSSNKWCAISQQNHLGSFDSAVDAAKAYNAYVKANFGDTVFLNEIDEE